LYRQATTETTLKTPLSRTHFPTCSLRFWILPFSSRQSIPDENRLLRS
jgi:hypothetical protein